MFYSFSPVLLNGLDLFLMEKMNLIYGLILPKGFEERMKEM